MQRGDYWKPWRQKSRSFFIRCWLSGWWRLESCLVLILWILEFTCNPYCFPRQRVFERASKLCYTCIACLVCFGILMLRGFGRLAAASVGYVEIMMVTKVMPSAVKLHWACLVHWCADNCFFLLLIIIRFHTFMALVRLSIVTMYSRMLSIYGIIRYCS